MGQTQLNQKTIVKQAGFDLLRRNLSASKDFEIRTWFAQDGSECLQR